MRTDSSLRACLIGLVTLNLVFVQMTGAARLHWLIPLYALTWLSPLLRPLIRSRLYRLAWNAGVLAVFGVLLRHATTEDLRFVLEDGLVLAGLCQVHLLNNLRAEQRTDLLFLNSIVIAILTGYLSQDLSYPIAFLAFVPFYVVGLAFQSLARSGARLTATQARRVVRAGVVQSSILLGATLLVFFVWPRDFDRLGYLSESFDFSRASGAEVGFADEMDLERQGRARASQRVVLTVTVVEGTAAGVPSLWRGATLDTTDGRRWWALEDQDLWIGDTGDPTWRRHGSAFVRALPTSPGDARVTVELAAGHDRLFMPLNARHLVPGEGVGIVHVDVFPDGTSSFLPERDGRVAPRYELALASGPGSPRQGTTPEEIDPGQLRFIALPRARRIATARELADRLAENLPASSPQHELVARFEDYLERNHAYLAPGEEGAAGSLEAFLGGAPGHCELFASALATMLRSRGVPCRVATGFRSREWDGSGRVLTVRRRDAHAWVEVFDPEAGWYAVDAVPLRSVEAGPGLWASLHNRLSALWAKVASFNQERRASVLAWVRELPSRSMVHAREHPLSLVGVVGAGIALAWLLRERRRRRTPVEIRRYRAALRRAGLTLGPAETPRELLARARRDRLARDRFEGLEAATAEHESSRYAA